MNSSIREVNRYDITIKGVVHSNFVKIDTWNGLASYQNETGIVIAKDHVDETMFSFMFKPKDEPEQVDTVIIMMSPEFHKESK